MEETVVITNEDLKIFCRLQAPDEGKIQRVVLGVHGLAGSTEDDIQRGIVEEMALFGAATIRFDFPAHGESPMGSEALTLHNCVQSLTTVADYAMGRFPQAEDLCIFASGFGAYVTLIALQEHMLEDLPARIKLVIQTPSVRMDETLLAMGGLSRETFWAMDRVTFRTKRPFYVTYSFYEELREHSALCAYPIPILILQGQEDAFIRMEDIRFFQQLNERAKLVIIPGASHRFLEPGAWDMVLDLTRDWFEFEQVLLSDWF